jgi:hypothetical protein
LVRRRPHWKGGASENKAEGNELGAPDKLDGVAEAEDTGEIVTGEQYMGLVSW